MRFLLLLQWCLLFIPVNSEKCDWKLPTKWPSCIQAIKYKVHDDKQALATCLEHFPTTFVDGKKNNNEITCTVDRQFQCDFMHDSVPIFDKCYTFAATETTMAEYLKTKKDTGTSLCAKEGGSLPVFLTMTQAKHIGMEAHRRGVSKMWANVNKEGNTIEATVASYVNKKAHEAMVEGTMLYKEPFKLYEGRYWNGEELKTTPIQNNKPEVPLSEKVDYLFFRSKNDHWNNLIQGSFERATADSKATIVCEYPAKIVPNQEKYCDRMGKNGLGLNAMYSKKDKRCLYTTMSYFALEGTKTAIEQFPGCKELPSDEQKAGLDDGTASYGTSDPLYKPLTDSPHLGTYRVAAIKMDTTIIASGSSGYADKVLRHCVDAKTDFKDEIKAAHRQVFEIYNHFMKKDYAIKMRPDWEKKYPIDECTDFPKDGGKMNSNTLAVRQGALRDVPVPVQFPAICSIQSNVDCQRQDIKCEKLFPNSGKICKNVDQFDDKTGFYASCVCPKFHFDHNGECKFVGGTYQGHTNKPQPGADASCAVMHKYNANNQRSLIEDWKNLATQMDSNGATLDDYWSDFVDRVVVRNGCEIRFWAHPIGWAALTDPRNEATTPWLNSGENDVPNHAAGTLKGWAQGMSASAYECRCAAAKAKECIGPCTSDPKYATFVNNLYND